MLTPTEAMEPVLAAAEDVAIDCANQEDCCAVVHTDSLRAAVVALVVAEVEAMPCFCWTYHEDEGKTCGRCQRLAAWRAM